MLIKVQSLFTTVMSEQTNPSPSAPLLKSSIGDLIQCFYIGQKRDSTVAAFQKWYPDTYRLQATYDDFCTTEGNLQLNPGQKPPSPAYMSYIVPADILLPDVPSEEDIIQIALATIQDCDPLIETKQPLYRLPWGNTRHRCLLILGKYSYLVTFWILNCTFRRGQRSSFPTPVLMFGALLHVETI